MRRFGITTLMVVLGGLAFACTQVPVSEPAGDPAPANPTAVASPAMDQATAALPTPDSLDAIAFAEANATVCGVNVHGDKVAEPAANLDCREVEMFTDPPPQAMTRGWTTDFTLHAVPFREIRSGGVVRDGIPPIDAPNFIEASRGPSFMTDEDPVIALEINGQAKAYPLLILMRHEIVNDELAGVPVSVTYCPLCNSAVVFDRRVGDQVLDFGVSGNLRHSDLVMWDRQTQSWWQQIEGLGIVGKMTGVQLEILPVQVISWADYKAAYPEELVLMPPTPIAYRRPPYGGYDQIGHLPFLFSDGIDRRMEAMERVVGISIGDQEVAYSFTHLKDYPIVNDSIGGRDIVVFYSAGGTLSPFAGLSGEVDQIVGASGVFERELDGETLTFTLNDEGDIIDEESGSRWDILGRAVAGPLEGKSLEPVAHGNHFWFAWAAFSPDTEIRTPGN